MRPGAFIQYACESAAVNASFTNVATVTATAPLGQTPTESDDTQVTVGEEVATLPAPALAALTLAVLLLGALALRWRSRES